MLIATDHQAFDWDHILTHASLVIDTRGATRKVLAERTGPPPLPRSQGVGLCGFRGISRRRP